MNFQGDSGVSPDPGTLQVEGNWYGSRTLVTHSGSLKPDSRDPETETESEKRVHRINGTLESGLHMIPHSLVAPPRGASGLCDHGVVPQVHGDLPDVDVDLKQLSPLLAYGRAQKYAANKLHALGASSVVLYGVGDGMFAYCCLLIRIPCLIIYAPNPGGAVHQQVIRKHLVGKVVELITNATPGSKWHRSNTQLGCRPDDDKKKAQEEAIKDMKNKSPQQEEGAQVPEEDEPTPQAKRALEEDEPTPAKRARVPEEAQEPIPQSKPKDSKSRGKGTNTAVTPAEPPPEPPTDSQPEPAVQTLPGGPSAEPPQPLSPGPDDKQPKRTPSPSSGSSSSSSSPAKKNCPVKSEDEAESKMDAE